MLSTDFRLDFYSIPRGLAGSLASLLCPQFLMRLKEDSKEEALPALGLECQVAGEVKEGRPGEVTS